jgi:type II restriction/modification system DNA methylase subunit YeeA
MVQREIESTDQAIDALVYGLYGLTEDEIKIVEG